jgi:hypothetical protein
VALLQKLRVEVYAVRVSSSTSATSTANGEEVLPHTQMLDRRRPAPSPTFFLRLSHSNALYLSFEPSLHRTSKTAALCNSACRSAEAQTRSINIISTYANTGTGRWSSIHSLPRLSGIEMSNYYQSEAWIIEAVHEHERSGLELTTSS